MNSKIIVDYREKKLIDKLKCSQRISNILEIRNLDIADIILQFETYSFYIERKTIPDLISSIKDGRYKEQKMRLQAHKQRDTNSQIMYIIEGPNKFRHQGEENLYYGAWISIVLRDNVPIFRTNSLEETASLIIRLLMRLQKEPNQFFNYEANNMTDSLNQNEIMNIPTPTPTPNKVLISSESSTDNSIETSTNILKKLDNQCKVINLDTSKCRKKNQNEYLNNITYSNQESEVNNLNNLDSSHTNTTQSNINTNNMNNNHNLQYLATISTKKKNNINPSNWEAIALSGIPGISVAIASEIFKQYQNLGTLYKKYEEINDDDVNEKLLSTIKLTTKTGKTRKLGLVASKKIYQYVFKHN
jgi:ERCC4-type nuclease